MSVQVKVDKSGILVGDIDIDIRGICLETGFFIGNAIASGGKADRCIKRHAQF